MSREIPLIDCPRCGRKGVLEEFEFCINCRKEWEPIKKQTLKDIKKNFISNWDKTRRTSKNHWTICNTCGSEARRLWITFDDLKQLLKDEDTTDVRKHFLHYNKDGFNIYLGYMGYSKDIYDKIKYMKK